MKNRMMSLFFFFLLILSFGAQGQTASYESCRTELENTAKTCRTLIPQDADDKDITFAICIFKKFSDKQQACVALLKDSCKEGPGLTITCQSPNSAASGSKKADPPNKAKAIR